MPAPPRRWPQARALEASRSERRRKASTSTAYGKSAGPLLRHAEEAQVVEGQGADAEEEVGSVGFRAESQRAGAFPTGAGCGVIEQGRVEAQRRRVPLPPGQQ